MCVLLFETIYCIKEYPTCCSSISIVVVSVSIVGSVIVEDTKAGAMLGEYVETTDEAVRSVEFKGSITEATEPLDHAALN